VISPLQGSCRFLDLSAPRQSMEAGGVRDRRGLGRDQLHQGHWCGLRLAQVWRAWLALGLCGDPVQGERSMNRSGNESTITALRIEEAINSHDWRLRRRVRRIAAEAWEKPSLMEASISPAAGALPLGDAHQHHAEPAVDMPEGQGGVKGWRGAPVHRRQAGLSRFPRSSILQQACGKPRSRWRCPARAEKTRIGSQPRSIVRVTR